MCKYSKYVMLLKRLTSDKCSYNITSLKFSIILLIVLVRAYQHISIDYWFPSGGPPATPTPAPHPHICAGQFRDMLKIVSNVKNKKK